jgi:hypothetical protein
VVVVRGREMACQAALVMLSLERNREACW